VEELVKTKQVTRDIGLANAPKRTCTDEHCPFHGTLSVRGRVVRGIVTSAKQMRTVIVELEALALHKKYKRYLRKKSRIAAHNPPCIDAHEGDIVRIGECRKIAKTVSFVVIETAKAEEEE
jgi:small subunit ribosomal protein S17